MKNKKLSNNIFIGTWKKLNEDVVVKENKKFAKTTSKNNLAVSLAAAFFIILITGQSLGFVRKALIDPILYEKYENSKVIVYSTRC